MLEAAYLRSGGDIDVKKELGIEGIEEDSDGSIAVLFGDSMFHSRIATKDKDKADDVECAKLRCDSEQDVIQALHMRIEETIKQGFPQERKEHLTHMLHKHI